MQRLAGGGRVLELGIGTGRIALPLSDRGVDVHGVEVSGSMLGKLVEKAGSIRLKLLHANFAERLPDGPFSLIFALVSTFYLLRSQAEQQRSLCKLATELTGEGLLLLENYEPSGLNSMLESGDVIYSFEQMIATGTGLHNYRARVCYVPPVELDKMAARAGLRLRERWSDWQGRTFKRGDQRHISVYEVSGSYEE